MHKYYKNLWISIDKSILAIYTNKVRDGGVAQLARAPGSYPVGHEFKSLLRYQPKGLP